MLMGEATFFSPLFGYRVNIFTIISGPVTVVIAILTVSISEQKNAS